MKYMIPVLFLISLAANATEKVHTLLNCKDQYGSVVLLNRYIDMDAGKSIVKILTNGKEYVVNFNAPSSPQTDVMSSSGAHAKIFVENRTGLGIVSVEGLLSPIDCAK